MRAFSNLYTALDETTKTSTKVDALVAYFAAAAPADAAWAAYFLVGRKPKQVVPSKLLRAWAAEEAGVPAWLFDESYDAVGDAAETIALLLPPPDPRRASDRPLSDWIERVLLPLRKAGDEARKTAMLDAWRSMDRPQRFVWNKLISGSFRVGVSQQLVTRALAKVGGLDAETVAHRLMGDWSPTPAFYEGLLAADATDADASRPYPFCLAHALEAEPATLGDPATWLAEWKWDGIRGQLVRRGGASYLWSRGEELVTDRYPELAAVGDALPDGTVIDGEILPWDFAAEAPLSFAQLQRRIGRKAVTRKILAEIPVVMVAYDLLEDAGADVRARPVEWRRERLEAIVAMAGDRALRISPIVVGASWDELDTARAGSRERGAEGLMLKRRGSPYRVGRVRGDWWKWKVAPFTVDAVLTAARRGSGKRASLYTDYTFSVWHEGRLVPIAQAYSGLTDQEIGRVDAFIRKHMVEAFGPVRTVKPELVFELAFEAIQPSTRHKSGVAVRFPRILRWRTDKPAAEADTLDNLLALLAATRPRPPAGPDG